VKHLRFLAFWICVQCLIVSCFLPSALWAGDPVIIGATLLQERFLTCVTQLSADDLRDTPNSDERLTVVILEHQKFLEMRDAFHAHKTKLAFSSLTPPTKPIPFPLHVVSVTFSPDFASLSIAADNFDDSPSFFVIFAIPDSHPSAFCRQPSSQLII